MTSAPQYPTIAIIGAGPSGLTLSRILHLSSIPTTIYELDASPTHRTSQGGSLDLHEESGQAAVKAAGLYDEFKKIMRPEGEAMRITDGAGKILYEEAADGEHKGPGQGTRPEVDRERLREMLLRSVPEESIKWGHKLVSATQASDGTYTLTFENAPPVSKVDLVVGADGAWSRVRPLVTETKPHYSGISCLEVRHRDVSTRNSAVADMVGQGTFFGLHDSKNLCGQRNGDDSIRVYAMMPCPEDWVTTCGIDWKDARKAKQEMAERYFSGWDEKLQRLIRDGDEDTVLPRVMYMLPPGHCWEGRAGVTLLGDAAHLMTPFAGEGVNLAMMDAMLLEQVLVDALKDGQEGGWDKEKVWKAVRAFEEEMFPRAGEKAQETWDNLQLFTQPEGAAQTLADFFNSMGPPPE